MKTLETLRRDWALATEIHKLEARLWRQVQRDGLQAILVTSAVRGEGKSTTAAYLATALAEHPQRRILAVDVDFRTPQLAEHLGVAADWSLDDVLNGRCRVADAIAPTALPNLDVITAALIEDEPTVLLKTAILHSAFNELRSSYDLILIDAPALIPVADTSMVLPLVDGVVLVAMAGRTTKPQLAKAREICLGLGATLLGLVVSNVKESSAGYASYSRRNGSTSAVAENGSESGAE